MLNWDDLKQIQYLHLDTVFRQPTNILLDFHLARCYPKRNWISQIITAGWRAAAISCLHWPLRTLENCYANSGSVAHDDSHWVPLLLLSLF